MHTEPTRSAKLALRRQARTGRVVGGPVLDRTWGASLRARMAVIAGGSSSFSWRGTFLALLLPATLVGAAAVTLVSALVLVEGDAWLAGPARRSAPRDEVAA